MATTTRRKPKTNDQMLKNLLKDLSSLDCALLRERIVFAMDLTVKDIEKNPDAWSRGIVHPNAYIQLNKVVQEHLGFDKD